MTDLEFTLAVLKDHGIVPNQIDKNICCLFHDETRPSARLFSDGSYHCWAAECQTHFFDGIGAIMVLDGCDFKEAIRIATDRYGYVYNKKEGPKDNQQFISIEDSIVRQVVKLKPAQFLSVYKTMDKLLYERDYEKLKKLHLKLLSGELL